MTKKVYKSAQGKAVDLGALLLKNENVRAVSTTPVNATGDMIDSTNRSIQKRTHQVNKQYRKQVQTNVSDDQVVSSRKKALEQTEPEANQPVDIVQLPDQVSEEQEQQSVSEDTVNEGTTGLAAAIAKARSVRQESLKTPAQIAKNTSGVKKI